MNKQSGRELLENAFRRKNYDRLLKKYIASCHPASEEDGAILPRAPKKPEGRFPNLAGFCRFLHIGTEDLVDLSEKYPDAIAYVYAVLEDEALNSSVSPTLLTAYLKRRLGYDKENERKEKLLPTDPQPIIRFEHDIYGDGA
ncbi:MAG: hypothetical protein IKA76_01110 [Clostridia bacterium]|nr:hypothetical protein [Clostridia bacterium]